MRAGLLIYGSLEKISGGNLYDQKLIEYLIRQGDEVEIISLPWRNYPSCLADNLSTALYQRLLQLKVDVLIQDELCHPSLFLLNMRLRQKIRYPFVSIVHHLRSSEMRPAWQNRLYRQIERGYLKTLNGIIYNSKTTRQAVELTGINTNPSASLVAYPGGDRFDPQITSEVIRQRAVQPGPLRLIFLGNVIRRKGLHFLIKALEHVPRAMWELDVVGNLDADKSYSRAIQRQVQRAGLVERVHFLGMLDPVKLESSLCQNQVLAVPSTYEGFGIAYLEGMSFGLPSIATTSGAAGEIIQDGQTGFLTPPGDVTRLANRLNGLCQDRELLARMGQAARQSYLEHPTWDQSAASIRSYLSNLVNGSQSYG